MIAIFLVSIVNVHAVLGKDVMELDKNDLPVLDKRGIPVQAYIPLERSLAADSKESEREKGVKYPVLLTHHNFAESVHDQEWFIKFYNSGSTSNSTFSDEFSLFSDSTKIKTALVDW